MARKLPVLHAEGKELFGELRARVVSGWDSLRSSYHSHVDALFEGQCALRLDEFKSMPPDYDEEAFQSVKDAFVDIYKDYDQLFRILEKRHVTIEKKFKKIDEKLDEICGMKRPRVEVEGLDDDGVIPSAKKQKTE